MATPTQLIVRKILKSGKEVFKRGNRRVSKSAFNSQKWRIGGGRAGTARRRNYADSFNTWMRIEAGGPPGGGKVWAQIVSKYPEKFQDYIDEYDRQIA